MNLEEALVWRIRPVEETNLFNLPRGRRPWAVISERSVSDTVAHADSLHWSEDAARAALERQYRFWDSRDDDTEEIPS